MAGDSPSGYSLAGQSGLIVFDKERDPGTGAWPGRHRESGAVDRRRQALWRRDFFGGAAPARRLLRPAWRSARAGARCRVPVRVPRAAWRRITHVPRARCADMAVSTTWPQRAGSPSPPARSYYVLLRVNHVWVTGRVYHTRSPTAPPPRPPRARQPATCDGCSQCGLRPILDETADHAAKAEVRNDLLAVQFGACVW